MKVELADIISNKKKYKVGFSFWHLFLGPLYLLFRLQFWVIPLLILYYYILPLPGMEYIQSLIYYIPMNDNAKIIVQQTLFFFRTSFTEINVYIGILLFVLIHLFISFTIDNYLLKKRIKKKKLVPFSQLDCQILTYFHIAKPGIKKFDEIISHVSRNSSAEQIWQEKNLGYTMILSKTEIENQSSQKKNKKVPNLKEIYSPTRDIVNIHEESSPEAIKLAHYRKLYSEGKITMGEFENLEAQLHKDDGN